MVLTKKFLKEQKKTLEKGKRGLEKELRSFAKKDPRIKGNWKTKFPYFGIRTADPSEEEDQVEEYETNLAVEHNLEVQLKKINNALERIKRGKYGVCKNCNKKIKIERLKAYPEADICINCTDKKP